jgi:DnaK suppressor protein
MLRLKFALLANEDVTTMLTEKERTQIRAVLEDEQKRLAKTSQNALAYSMNHERNIGRDSIDESMEEEIFSTEMRLHDREKFLLGKINKQLVRLRAGEIDVCEDCGESISFKRLMARPVTTLCIDCKEQSEREEQAAEQAGRGGFAEIGDMGGGEGGGEAKVSGGLEE